MKSRFYGADSIKGLLIILVIVGHILRGTLDDSFGRYIIYSFHMPLFIGVSGFLVSGARGNNGIKSLLNHIKRIIIPWIMGVFIYGYILGMFTLDKEINILQILGQAVIKPYYHLWFLLGYSLYIGLYSGLRGDRKNDIGLIIGLVLAVMFYGPSVWGGGDERLQSIVKIITRSFKPQFFLFFMIGAKLREIEKELPRGIFETGIISVLLFGVMVKLFFHRDTGMEGYIYYLFNGVFIIFVLNCIVGGCIPRCRFLEWMGKNTMSFYLWHVLGKIALENYVGVDNLGLYYRCSAVSVIMLILLVYIWSQMKSGIKRVVMKQKS